MREPELRAPGPAASAEEIEVVPDSDIAPREQEDVSESFAAEVS